MNRVSFLTLLFLLSYIADGSLYAYPYDGYVQTGIRRLERLRLVIAGEIRGTIPPSGGQKICDNIQLNLVDINEDESSLFNPDPVLQQKIEQLFPDRHESYSLALLDITPGRPIRFAAWNQTQHFSPGSVGKLVVIAGLFSELQKRYPESFEKRVDLLKNRMITADQWIQQDEHEVPIYDPETQAYAFRRLQIGDTFSLYEWADHMLSVSANAAASIVWKEIILMHAFGEAYPPSYEEEQTFFSTTSKLLLQDMAVTVVNEPLRRAGISEEEWNLGSFFTQYGKNKIPGKGGSHATPMGFLKYLIALEKGQIVDEPSSLEIKKLMYMTARRIRYASSPALANAAVYFKSGSLYRCKAEPDFICKKYMGNVENVMNSVAIVEHPDGCTYLVAMMSNILRKNSAVEHQTLATYIDRIVHAP